MTCQLKKTVVMVGMMGAGKTAVGTALARLIGVPFLDSDTEIETAADRTIAEIFTSNGEAFFRSKESQVIGRLLSGPPGILSTGGGAFLSERNRDLVRQAGVSVWLQADLEVLWARVRHKDSRPLLRTADPYATLKQLCFAREPFYAQADITVRSQPEGSIDGMARTVLRALKQRPDVLAACKKVAR